MKQYRFRSKIRRGVSKHPMSQRRNIHKQLASPDSNIGGRYSKIMRYASKSKVVKRPWYKRIKHGKRTKTRIEKVTKNKTLRTGLLGAAAVGTILTVLPKETLGEVADTVQKFGENVYNIAENLGDTAGSLVKAIGVTADGLSNGIGFVAENFNTIVVVGLGGWVVSKFF